jgi:F0F1-type ATP synthase assembly protein I
LKKDENDDRYRMVRQSGLLATIPFMLAVPPIAGLLIGRFIDNRINTNPVFTIILMVFGFAAGIKEVAGVLKKANADNEKDNQDKKQ